MNIINLKKMKRNKTIPQNDINNIDDDEIIDNIDEFGTIEELDNENYDSLKENSSKKILQKIRKKAKELRRTNPKMAFSLTNQGSYHSNKDSKDTTRFSKDKNSLKIQIKQQKIKSPIRKIVIYDTNNNNINYYSTSKKSIFSKISENLYNSNRDNISKKLLDSKKNDEDNYNQLTMDKYLDIKSENNNNYSNKAILHKNIKPNLILNKHEKNLRENNHNNHSRNNIEIIYGSKKLKKPKMRTPKEFLEDQKIFDKKHKIHIDNIIKQQDQKLFQVMKDKPCISNDSRRIANNMKNNENKNIFLKLYKDFSTREKKKEEMRRKTFKEYSFEYCNSKILSKKIIKQNSERLYKEYLKKNNLKNENKIKQIYYFKSMAVTKFVNKSSNNILYSKFLKKYKNILNSIFNKTIEDNFEIYFQDYLTIINELGIINKNYKLLFKNEEEKNKSNMCKNIENQKFSSLWKNKNIISEIFNIKEDKKNNDETRYKNDIEYKLIKDSWKLITKSKEFNQQILGYSERLLFFLFSVLGIYDGSLNNSFIRNECSFLLEKNIKDNIDNNNNSLFIDEKLSKHIYKTFYKFRKSIYGNLNYKKIENNKSKINHPINNNKRYNKNNTINYKRNNLYKNKSNNQNENMLIYKHINNFKNKNILRNEINNNYYSNTEVPQDDKTIGKKYKGEINNSSEYKIQNDTKKIFNKTCEGGNRTVQIYPLKKVKYIFQIKVGDQKKKLILYDVDNRREKIEEFCDLYKLKDFEKEQIIKIIGKKIGKL